MRSMRCEQRVKLIMKATSVTGLCSLSSLLILKVFNRMLRSVGRSDRPPRYCTAAVAAQQLNLRDRVQQCPVLLLLSLLYKS